ncbi:hypothetical protein [Streptomyces rochei]|uniref:hypothetical protein n=1 Tax=Streptomyces rochei TaxID=1928 RepID=UPI003F4B09C0
MESLALAAHTRRWATTVTRITRKTVDALNLGELEPVPEVQGVTDAVNTFVMLSMPASRTMRPSEHQK